MSSSDSDDDCYGNVAQQLEKLKKTFVKEKLESYKLDDSLEVGESSKELPKNEENTSIPVVEDCNVTVNSTDNDEFTLDAIIARNSKTKPKRGRGGKRKSSDASACSSTQEPPPGRRKTRNSRRGMSSSVDTDQNTSSVEHNSVIEEPLREPTPPAASETATTSARGRGRGARRGAARGRGSRGRGRGRIRNRRELWAIFDNIFDRIDSRNAADYPIYSVGNTDEYPDQSDNQQLFSSRPADNDVQVIDDEDPLDNDNEEMSVKVYWQNLEVFKFKIRKYQKLTQIFNYFMEKEGVGNDKLLFMYNDRIIKMDDTPDSINYSIAKFIDGGIVNQNVSHLATSNSSEKVINGIKIKFQCQNMKKPFETTLGADDKFAAAMVKCAEHLEVQLERLKFYFDGDLISNKSTPRDLELEGGECIDVKISS
ncbi:unnamed protein product [Spodoptera littoralis]|uniref:Rad60/SUMO-like domain-containing protein n=1 Tax=Spodoptera littoralis TaxID=7109 RepID=A0A9P0N367_SPOLI|nr:unnamed protein product [Spodoptera littoralis]CAH1643037.1 unnamed protein product [Spodoptera littoralis]